MSVFAIEWVFERGAIFHGVLYGKRRGKYKLISPHC